MTFLACLSRVFLGLAFWRTQERVEFEGDFLAKYLF